MPNAADILRDAKDLPVEQRVQIAESLLRSLNSPDADIERCWLETAQRRLRDVEEGTVQPIAGSDVGRKVRARFSR